MCTKNLKKLIEMITLLLVLNIHTANAIWPFDLCFCLPDPIQCKSDEDLLKDWLYYKREIMVWSEVVAQDLTTTSRHHTTQHSDFAINHSLFLARLKKDLAKIEKELIRRKIRI